jgi:hypothetical protein
MFFDWTARCSLNALKIADVQGPEAENLETLKGIHGGVSNPIKAAEGGHTWKRR